MSLPVAQLPNGITKSGVASYNGTVMDTTFSLPNGATWTCHTSAMLAAALVSAQPGDVIVLDAGTVYSGNFVVPAKVNSLNKWIYIISSAYGLLPAPGTRVGVGDAVNMPKLVSPNVSQALQFSTGSNYVRLVGVEVYSASTYAPVGYTPGVFYGYGLIATSGNWPPTAPIPDHIVIDRCYVHGDATHDLQAGIQCNFTYTALVDSYVSDIHMKGTDTTAWGAFFSPGPFKATNNYLSAAGENIIFGGSGDGWGGNVPSDIEVRNNYLFKPLAWIGSPYDVKNGLELKSAQRVLFDSNTIENVWYANQLGYAVVLTVRTSQSGNVAVVNDVTITNNVLKNVCGGFNTLAADDQCGVAPYTSCTNSGSQSRWFIYNNLVEFFDPTIQGGARNVALNLQPGLNRSLGTAPPTLGMPQDVVFQHNTIITNPSTPNPFGSVWVGNPSGYTPAPHLTSNIWILDNVFTKQPTGDAGITAAVGLPWPNTAPNDFTSRVAGNVILLESGEKPQGLPASNDVSTTAPVFDAAYRLVTPDWSAHTSDGLQAGCAPASVVLPPTYSISGVIANAPLNSGVLLLDAKGLVLQTTMTDSSGNYSFLPVIAGNYAIRPIAAAPAAQSVAVQNADLTDINFSVE